MNKKKCDPRAYTRCPDRDRCMDAGDAEFFVGSECDRFNEYALAQPMTNADRIRAMSDEELAEMLVSTTAFDCITCGLYVNNPNKKRNENEQCLEWLKQPAEVAE